MKWLFLVHQVHTPNSRERVKVWRAIKKTGAVLYRNSVYVLPFSKERLEDFQWVCQQINDSEGEASVFTSKAQNEKEDAALSTLFRKTRESDYEALRLSAERWLTRYRIAAKRKTLSGKSRDRLDKEGRQILETLEELKKIDFFSDSPPKALVSILGQVSSELHSIRKHTEAPVPIKTYSKNNFQNKTWTTRKDIHIDRLCSAWLIQRFIDPAAKFVFGLEGSFPAKAIPFDVFGAEFSHHGEDCTFETLVRAFQLRDPAIRQIAEIIHDIDLKDHKFDRAEANGLDLIVRSLAQSLGNDHQLLKVGSIILDALHQSFSRKSLKR